MNESTEPTTDNETPAETADAGDVQLDAVLEATQRRQTIVEVAAAKLGVGNTKVCDLLRNVWKTAKDQPELTDQELFQGMSLIARFELDPITREIYVTRDNKDRLLTIIGIDGWIKILDRTPGYDGFEQEFEYSDDDTYSAVTTKIYSRIRRHPITYVARRSEWGGMGGLMWGKLKNHMLVLLSIRHAARLFAAIGGNVVTEGEAEWMDDDTPPHHDNPSPSPDAPKVQPRGERVTQVDCVALRESWDAYRDKQGFLLVTDYAFEQFVEGATGMERGKVTDASNWTRADIDKCHTAIAMEAPEEPPDKE